MQRVCESCYSRGDVKHRDMQVTQYTVQPPLISYGGDDLLSMEQVGGYLSVFCLFVCLFVCLLACFFVCLFVCLCVCLFVCLIA